MATARLGAPGRKAASTSATASAKPAATMPAMAARPTGMRESGGRDVGVDAGRAAAREGELTRPSSDGPVTSA